MSKLPEQLVSEREEAKSMGQLQLTEQDDFSWLSYQGEQLREGLSLEDRKIQDASTYLNSCFHVFYKEISQKEEENENLRQELLSEEKRLNEGKILKRDKIRDNKRRN